MKNKGITMCLECNEVSMIIKDNIKVDDIVFDICLGSCGGKVTSKVIIEVSKE